MNKQNIIDYVLRTPLNTNKAILDEMLDDLVEDSGQGTGGGQGGVSEFSVDGKSLVFNDSKEAAIKGYEQAKQGQMLVKDANKGLAWINPLSETTLNTAVANAQSAASTASNYATQAGNQAIAADVSAKNAARALEIIQHDIFWFGTIDEYNALEEITEDKIYVI